MTNLNTLKNWFKTGLKPTQEQFWEWMDSFFHKEEKIPMAQIEELETTLQNKADAEQLQHKANTDASGLNEEHVISWKKALGVGELPTNIATIDEGEKTGNVHTKEQVAELLKNSGKNLGNSDLVIPTGEVRTLDTTGAKLLVKGLENKKNEAGFKYRLKANERGELGVSDEVDISVNIPDNITITGDSSPTNIVVNHIYPKDISAKIEYLEQIKNIMKVYKNYDFIPITDWNLETKDNLNIDTNKVENDIIYIDNNKNNESWRSNNANPNIYIYSNTILPNDKDWILKISGNCNVRFMSESFNTILNSLGVGQIKDDNNVSHGMCSVGYTGFCLGIIGLKNKSTGTEAGAFTSILIKTGEIITTLLYVNEKLIQYSSDATIDIGDYIPKIVMYPPYENNVKIRAKFSYKILN